MMDSNQIADFRLKIKQTKLEDIKFSVAPFNNSTASANQNESIVTSNPESEGRFLQLSKAVAQSLATRSNFPLSHLRQVEADIVLQLNFTEVECIGLIDIYMQDNFNVHIGEVIVILQYMLLRAANREVEIRRRLYGLTHFFEFSSIDKIQFMYNVSTAYGEMKAMGLL